MAATYDDVWSHAPAGLLQRHAVWRHIDPLVVRGHRVLDLGCGTGEDAVHLAGRGASVLALDASSEMVTRARQKGVNAEVMQIEDLGSVPGVFDLVLSNFGALNCIRDLARLRKPLAQMIRSGGHLAVCLMGRFCLWESGYYGLKGSFRKAARRWSGETTTSAGLRVYYPLVRNLRKAFAPDFAMCADIGIGACVPPSFVPVLPEALLRVCGRADRRLEGTGLARVISDHRLLVFRRF
jgi:SAM-dependent methyltransferase